MFSIFSTREIVGALYFLVLVFIVGCAKKTRGAVVQLIKSAFAWKMIISFCMLVIYTFVIVYVLSFLPFWKNIYIKDVVMWTIFVGVPYSYNAILSGEKDKYFTSTFKESLKLVVLLEFFTGTFTFNLGVELILQPVITFIILLQITASTKEEWKLTSKFLDGLLGTIGLIILGFTIKAAIGSYADINPIDTMVSFFTPIVFSILFIPCAYLFALIAKYEIVYMRMGFKEPKDRKIRWKRHLSVFFTCGLSYKRLCEFHNEYIKKLYIRMTQEDFEKIVKDFKLSYK